MSRQGAYNEIYDIWKKIMTQNQTLKEQMIELKKEKESRITELSECRHQTIVLTNKKIAHCPVGTLTFTACDQ